METIYKYPLLTTDEQTIVMPSNAEILTVQVQKETPFMWAKVNTDNEPLPRKIRIFGTGHPIEEGFVGKYIGSYQLFDGNGVFHVFLV